MKQLQFENIAVSIRNKALSIANVYGIDADEAEDCAQDVLLKLWALHNDITDEAHAEALATTMAQHAAIDRHRRRHYTAPIESQWNLSDERNAQPDIAMEDSENEQWLQERLSKLPQTEYEILRLRQVERKSSTEIAAILGITQTSVATYLWRARTKLMNDIKQRKI
jgi:RNA polymerase sigma factor (sigma-70 family)